MEKIATQPRIGAKPRKPLGFVNVIQTEIMLINVVAPNRRDDLPLIRSVQSQAVNMIITVLKSNGVFHTAIVILSADIHAVLNPLIQLFNLVAIDGIIEKKSEV
jgi:hypothetical protein